MRSRVVEDEERLDVHRLLGPERAVVVEHGDALGHWDEGRVALARHLLDERHDRPSGGDLVPGGQRVRGEG
jgi:hypothetical protein